MQTLASQRCLNHPEREAVARCPECSRFFCRECITEHDDRVICAACLKKLAKKQDAAPGRRANLWPLAQAASGLCMAWFVFYVIGRLLLAAPSEFHDQSLWKMSWLDSLGGRDDE